MEKRKEFLEDLIGAYRIANDLFITLDTISREGEAALMYQFRYSLDHLLDGIEGIQSGNLNDKQIESEIKGSRGHLVRIIYDCAELIILRNFKALHNSVRFVSPKAIQAVYPDFYTEYKTICESRDKLINYKINKSNDVSLDELKEIKKVVFDSIKIVESLDIKKKLMRKEMKQNLVWTALGFIISMSATALITYFCSR